MEFSFDKIKDLYGLGQYLEEINKISSNESNINWMEDYKKPCMNRSMQDGLTNLFEYPSDASYAFSLNINQKLRMFCYGDTFIRIKLML